jgi:hypothetical protein
MATRMYLPCHQSDERSGEVVSFEELSSEFELWRPRVSTLGIERSTAGRVSFIAIYRNDLRRSRDLGPDLRFEREKQGSERNPQGSFPTPKPQSRNLGISTRTDGKS